ncbi:MAG: restriction endonuclease subunit S [Nitrosomonas sp.]|nr:restriction endonuclease subunit S [Nitrosomonas sp.]
MGSKYQAYPEYKDSGVEWLGETPKHWQLAELKRYAFVKGGYAFNSDSFIEDGEPVIRISDIKQDGSVSLENCKCVSDKQANQYGEFSVSSGELVMAMTGATIGKAGLYSYSKPALINQRVGVFKCNEKNLDYKFLWYVLSSYGYQVHIKLTAFGGAQPNISDTGMVGYKAVIPIKEEQLKITNFLDHETARIDTLIEKQQQLIKLLKEKRQAVISHAVTKGLNPNAKMRDSGVEWLGEAPEHWDVKRIGLLFTESSARACSDVELEYPVLSVSIHHGISDKELNEEELDRKIARSEDKSLYKVVHYNDLAYNMMRAWQGGFGASKLSGLVSPAYVVCQPRTSLNSYYFELILRTPNAVTELKRYSRGITDFRLRLYWDEFKNICVPIPPAEEIDSILNSISTINSTYDSLVIVAERQIELLQERRTALISAAVTGKIDVRNWQAPNG